mgnify:FL=1
MGISSDQRVSDTADSMQTDDIAAVGAEEVKESLSDELAQSTQKAEAEFEGFDGSRDYEWITTAEAFMEAMPLTWIAVAVFVGGLIYSYLKQKRS